LDGWAGDQEKSTDSYSYSTSYFQLTTSFNFTWGFAHLLHHPEYLEFLQAELDEVIGSPERIVTMADRTKLPYTNAVVNVKIDN
jgi:hypothetical protein